MAFEVFDTDVYPDFLPVTFTVIFLPLSAATNVYDGLVAPVIALLARNHRYESFTPDGANAPGSAVSHFPTATVPETLGTGAVNVPTDGSGDGFGVGLGFGVGVGDAAVGSGETPSFLTSKT